MAASETKTKEAVMLFLASAFVGFVFKAFFGFIFKVMLTLLGVFVAVFGRKMFRHATRHS